MARLVHDVKATWADRLQDMASDRRTKSTQTASGFAREFCEETSFHGIKYFVKRDLHYVKRLFWICCWLISLAACCYYIYTNLAEYQSSPILTTIDSTTYPITKFKYPSVTICNFNQIMKNRFPPSQESVIGNVSYPDGEWLDITQRLRFNLFSGEPLHELYSAADLTLSSEQIYCTIKESAQRCEDMIIYCRWRWVKDCKMLFTQIPTKFGFCCNINVKNIGLPSVHKAEKCPQDKALPTALPQETPPIMQALPRDMELTSTGVDQGLTVLLDTQANEYVSTAYQAIGFKEAILPPGLHHEGIVISPGNEIFIPVSASSTFTTAAALKLDPSQRRCYDNNEKKLLHYPEVYSHEACINNYLAVLTVERCGCRDYHMPGTERICLSREDIACMEDMMSILHSSTAMEEKIQYACLPRCNTTSYTASPTNAILSRAQFKNTVVGAKYLLPLIKQHCRQNTSNTVIQDMVKGICHVNNTEDVEHLGEESPQALEKLLDYMIENVALVHVFFGQATGTRYKKDVNATPSQIVGNVGGLMGLFLGFSLLSAAEVAFYLMEICQAVGSSVLSRIKVSSSK